MIPRARALVVVAIVLLALTTVTEAVHKTPAISVSPAGTEPAATLRSLPLASPEAGPALLARSPFAPDRSTYARARIVATPAPPTEVHLVAVFAVHGQPKASLVISGQQVDVSVGDQTPAGAVTAIQADAVVLGESPGRTVQLFK
jgi:type IV pilus biogenesis protein PilP